MGSSRLWYPLALAGLLLAIVWVLNQGSHLTGPRAVPLHTHAPPAAVPSTAAPPGSVLDTLRAPLPLLLLQLILIVIATRLCGMLATRFGQTAVIGEMFAGLLLGPSLLGWCFPGLFDFLFLESSLGTLRLLSQIGVCLFMFIVGMEMDLTHMRGQARTAVLVSQVSILLPYLLGVVSALFLFSSFAAPGSTFLAFALFLGISLSITAFPVLARILEERGMTKTALGSTALVCAAINDFTAWSLLGFVVAVVKAHSWTGTALNLGVGALFIAFLLVWVRPRMGHWLDRPPRGKDFPGKAVMATVIVCLFACALTTELIGIHALFGSFLAGVIMPPRREFREALKIRLELVSSVFLLPLFFAFTGLRTQVGTLHGSDWLLCGGLILVATAGKLGGAMITARLTGVSWLDSFTLGALMNTRGLMELVALNIGYDLGILSAGIFTMLVLMALITTALTAPLITLSHWLRARRPGSAAG